MGCTPHCLPTPGWGGGGVGYDQECVLFGTWKYVHCPGCTNYTFYIGVVMVLDDAFRDSTHCWD